MRRDPPEGGFDERHFKLAEAYGFERGRIGFFNDFEDLRIIALEHGITEEYCAEHYSESTYGVLIQADDIPGGRDAWIYVRSAIPHDQQLATYDRLSRHGLNPPIQLADESRKDLVYFFLLLHEIAHHDCKHSPETPYEQAEREADTWAIEHLDLSMVYPEE